MRIRLLTKCKSSSKCLERECMMGFATSWITPKLSQYNLGIGRAIQNSCKRDWIQIMSARAATTLLYFVFVLLRETTFCFFETHEIRLWPTKSGKFAIIQVSCPVWIVEASDGEHGRRTKMETMRGGTN